MKLLGYARAYFGLPYRQTQGMVQAYCSRRIPKVPNYSSINRRINKLDIKVNPNIGKDVVIAIDSTGVKVANRGGWIRHKWKIRRGFLKIHVGADIKSKKIVSYKITDEHSHDAQHLPSLVEQVSNKSKITKVLADGAYDSKNNFSCLYHKGIIPAIRVRKNSTKARGCYPRKLSVISQLTNYNYWRDSVSYGHRWIMESIFSSFKRMFGEHVMAHKTKNMIKELELKISLYNLFVSI